MVASQSCSSVYPFLSHQNAALGLSASQTSSTKRTGPTLWSCACSRNGPFWVSRFAQQTPGKQPPTPFFLHSPPPGRCGRLSLQGLCREGAASLLPKTAALKLRETSPSPPQTSLPSCCGGGEEIMVSAALCVKGGLFTRLAESIDQ